MPIQQPVEKGFQAAVVRQKGGPFQIELWDIMPPRHDEVLVRVVATGMCHTDMVARDQVYPVPQPVVLGHEGAGVVEAVGENVTKVQKGDHVVLSFHSCGACPPCQAGPSGLLRELQRLQFRRCPAWRRLARAVRARPDPAERPVLRPVLVCRLCHRQRAQRGEGAQGRAAGAARAFGVRRPDRGGNRAQCAQGRAGGELRGLRRRGCRPLGRDGRGGGRCDHHFRRGSRSLSAGARLQLGATHVVNSRDADAVEAIRAITGKGVDFSMDRPASRP